ncbi:MAG: tetratricopeptide repeat protein [bacterium]
MKRPAFLLSILFLWITFAQIPTVASLKDAAIHYNNKDYQSALDLYLETNNKKNDSAFFYNLGNIYTKLEQYGKARLFYTKAHRLSPRDREIKENINVIKTKLIDQELLQKSFNTMLLEKICDSLNINESWLLWFTLLSLLNLLLWTKKYRPNVLTAKSILPVTGLLIVSTLFLVIKLNQDVWQKKGIIITPKAAVHSGPSENLPVLFFIHEGSEYHIKQNQNEWEKIKLSTGLTGWTKAINTQKI